MIGIAFSHPYAQSYFTIVGSIQAGLRDNDEDF